MSLIYCEKHNHTYDSDYITYCDGCLREELENNKTNK
jgi:hypothetical protein